MPFPKADLIIFDFDGVLIDSEIIAARAEAKILKAAGVDITEEDIMVRYAGMNFQEMMKDIEREFSVPLSISMLADCEKAVDQGLKRVKALPGAMRLVESIDIPKCICSNSAGYRLANSLKTVGMTKAFGDHVYSARDVGAQKPKPAPDVFLHAIEKFGADPKKTFVLEDSIHGAAGAKAAGARVIGYTGASHIQPGQADRMTEAGAETVINNHADFAEVVDALLNWSEADFL